MIPLTLGSRSDLLKHSDLGSRGAELLHCVVELHVMTVPGSHIKIPAAYNRVLPPWLHHVSRVCITMHGELDLFCLVYSSV